MPDASRVDAGRRRAAAAKRAVTLTAAGGFVVALMLARQTNPGVAAGSRTQLVPPAGISSEVNQGLSLGGGSIGPSSSGGSGVQPAPQVQSATS
ncbi:MAG TPA: hypothetical protein VJ986_11240 [Gaiellaceae bacterium]|nr:hypothetical protein [Gaiellaceae bacterium]